ncbi:hypothetical protein DPMN_074663 [Dreissena polymorpha]|uniref:Uncharacterized protein n=1 Tax=Dreissena polymorpha TaxID=45954 RepID=A0A9D3YK92_DREPO|nr:hypothetical protein DPMN_074663 [Dreissena polymorpha]
MCIILKSKHCIALIIIKFFTGPRSTPSRVQQTPQTPANQLSPSISEESIYWTPQQPELAPQGLSGEAQGTGQVARLVKDVEEARPKRFRDGRITLKGFKDWFVY